jgi:hypothetical protein
MKKTLSILSVLLAVAALFGSCAKTGKVIPEREPEGLPPIEEVEPVSLSLTFVLPDGGLKTAWVEGDQIVVHGEYAKDQVTVTLAAADITDGGKKATKTVDGLKPYVREDCESNLYASWPAELTSNPPHCFFYSGFSTTNALLMVASNDTSNQFAFRELTMPLTFKVDGAYDTYAFTGRKDAIVGYEYFQAKLTDNEFILDQYHKNPLVTIGGIIEGGSQASQQIFIPIGMEIPDGYDLKLYQDGTAKKVYTVKTETVIGKGQNLDLGDITSLLKDYVQAIDVTKAVALNGDVTANCYIVTAPGVYKFPTVKGNSNKSVGVVESTKVLWETWSNGEEVTEGSLIYNSMYEGGLFYLEVPEPFHTGNALVAALDEDENILWSWHIWMPETMPTTGDYGYTSGCQIMSRNLGALIDTQPGAMADSRSFGLFYQWGRKDPFLGPKAAGAEESATFAGVAMTTYEGQMTQNQGEDVTEETAANPTVFIVQPKLDWNTVDDREAWGDQERSNKKTIYDPCPAGYRVAGRKRALFFEPDKNAAVAGTFVASAENFYYQIGNPASTLPLCGYLDSDGTYHTDGALVWNTHMDHDTANLTYCMLVSGGVLKKGQMCRSIGASVRCETYDE